MSSDFVLTTILEQIEHSSIRTIPRLLQHLLVSDITDYQASASAIQLPMGTHLILDSLLSACPSTVTEWAIEVAKKQFRNEMMRVSDSETGLHFKAFHARTADLMGFDLHHIARKLEDVAPLMWGVVQDLLDANSVRGSGGKTNMDATGAEHNSLLCIVSFRIHQGTILLTFVLERVRYSLNHGQ